MSEQCPHIVGMSWCEQCAEDRIDELEAERAKTAKRNNALLDENAKLHKEVNRLRGAIDPPYTKLNAIAEHCWALCAKGVPDDKRAKGVSNIYRYIRQREPIPALLEVEK